MSQARQAIKFLCISSMITLTLASCAIQKNEGSESVPDHLYDLDISYSHEEKAFIFKLESLSDSEICIPKMRWTDENGGHYFFEDRQIYFVNDGVRYDIKDLASGYCTPQENGGCVHVLGKNDRIHGKLSIEDFAVPTEVYLEEDFNPQLHYPYSPRFCN